MVAPAIGWFITAFGQGHMALKLFALTSGSYKSMYGPLNFFVICKYAVHKTTLGNTSRQKDARALVPVIT